MFSIPFPGRYVPTESDWFEVVWVDLELEKVGWKDFYHLNAQPSRFSVVRRWANESVYEEPTCLV